MNIIPPYISAECESDAEKMVFRLFEKIEGQNNSFVFHSVNLPEHQYKQWAEIDFLLISNKGILVFEVKGGGVSRENGVWIHTDRFGRRHEKSEGPDEQAKTAMYSLRGKLERKLRTNKFNKIPFGWAVIFPDIDYAAHALELPIEIICDINSMNSSGLQSFINGTYNYWKKKIRNNRELLDSEIKSIVNYVRPNFDLVPSLKKTLFETHIQLVKCTSQQYETLNDSRKNDRLLIEGGGGTGKTLLVVELAKRHKDKKILVTCRSPILAEFIKAQVSGELIDVLNISELMDIYTDNSQEPVYDMLIVDEGQDLLSIDILVYLGGLLINNLEKGCWRWFMDLNNQAEVDTQYSPLDDKTDKPNFSADSKEDGYEWLKSCNPHIISLSHNCRNTEQIILDTQLYTGADIGKARIKGKGPRVKYQPILSSEDTAVKLEKTLNKWSEKVNNLNEIVILSPVRYDLSSAVNLSQKWKNRIQILTRKNVVRQDNKKVLFSTIREYKGLDKPIVAVIDLEKTMVELSGNQVRSGTLEHLDTVNDNTRLDMRKHIIDINVESFLYVAMTRSNAVLWIAVNDIFKTYLKQQEEKNLQKIADQYKT